MRNSYRRFGRDIKISFNNMENHIHRFLNKFRPGFGLLRNFRGTLPARNQIDVEHTQPDLIQSRSQDETTDVLESALQPEITSSVQDDDIDSSAAKSILVADNTEDEVPPQPQFTEGPPRFVIAKDGSKDCVALLVSEGFLAKLCDLFQANRDINAFDGPLYHANMDAKNIESSVRKAEESLETAENEEKAEEHHAFIEQQTSELLKINHWRKELEKERDLVEGKLELSRSHTQWVLETAMREADYLGPEKPLPAILLRDEESERREDKVETSEPGMPVQSPAISVASEQGGVELSEEELQRQAAYNEFIDRSQLLDTLQGNFENQQNNYRVNLARFEQEVEANTSNMSRSDFDRRSVQYGQQLTRALIDAEEAFEEARERAQALGAISSDYGHEFYYGAEYEESWPANKIAEYNASHDWSFIEGWMDAIIPGHTTDRADDVDPVEVDEWDAGEIEVNDSISVIDCEEYRQEIDRYRRMCARLEDPCPEARWLGQPDARVLERRGSFWM